MARLVFLGRFGELAPASLSRVALPAEVHTLSDLWRWLLREYPALGRAMTATTTRLVVNHAVARDLSEKITDGDEVAFLPPMSGG